MHVHLIRMLLMAAFLLPAASGCSPSRDMQEALWNSGWGANPHTADTPRTDL